LKRQAVLRRSVTPPQQLAHQRLHVFEPIGNDSAAVLTEATDDLVDARRQRAARGGAAMIIADAAEAVVHRILHQKAHGEHECA